MYKKLLFLVLVVDHDFVAEAALSSDRTSQAMKPREKLTSLYAGIDLKVYFISFLKLLEILA